MPLSARAEYAIAFLAGAATVAGFAPVGAFPLPVVTLALLLWLWRRHAGARKKFFLGFAFGAGLFGVGVSWVYVSLHDFGLMPAPLAGVATLIFCAILALYPSAAGAALALFHSRPGFTALLAFPALWTLAEWMRTWVLTGFPWLSMGYSQAGMPLGAIAPVLGVFGVSFLTAFSSGLLFLAATARSKVGILGAAGIAVLFAGGHAISTLTWTEPAGSPIRVALLQGNVSQDLKFVAERYASTLAAYERLITSSNARLIVLPETAIPRFLDTVDPAYLRRMAELALERRADILVGAPTRDAEGGYFNSVVSTGVSPPQRYSKSHLVPFGEFVPPGFGWIVKILSIPLSDFSAGPSDPRPLAVAGQRVAPNICYEDAFGEEIIRQLPEATLLVNLSNVAWFGDSLAPSQHLQIARMRAIETGRYMLRATNTGITAIIDQRGEVVARLPQFTEGRLQGEAQGYAGASPYVRWGNFPIVIACLVILAAGWLGVRRRGVGLPGESR
ncbi:MAG: apolipoprotein N-acyltransferase [Betaproteobacteria bacterium]|nr:apolipoprotein N-acyltransferase [Betaproteobacteria bacterium]